MSIMLDLLCIITVAVFVIFGFHKGIIQTVISVIGTVISSVLSMVLADPVAEAIYNGGIKSALIQKMEESLKLSRQLSSGDPSGDILKSLPQFIKNSMPGFKVTSRGLSSALQQSPESAEKLLRPIIISFMSVFVSVFLFMIFMVIIKIVIKIFASSLGDSGFSIIDSFFGALIGLIEGFAVVILAVFIIRISIPHLEHVPEIISDETISESYVFEGIYDSPLMTGFVKGATKSPNIN